MKTALNGLICMPFAVVFATQVLTIPPKVCLVAYLVVSAWLIAIVVDRIVRPLPQEGSE